MGFGDIRIRNQVRMYFICYHYSAIFTSSTNSTPFSSRTALYLSSLLILHAPSSLVRDAVGLQPSPDDHATPPAIYFTENGRDNMQVHSHCCALSKLYCVCTEMFALQGPLGHSHIPPDEFNRVAVDMPASAASLNFGFPFCYGNAAK